MTFGSFGEEQSQGAINEINMVPLIDVMLVLLIIFIITAPLLTHSIKIDLPAAESELNEETPDTITLSIDDKGSLYWNDEAIDEAQLEQKLAETAALPKQPQVNLRADQQTIYRKLAHIMSLAHQAGIEKLGFITVPE